MRLEIVHGIVDRAILLSWLLKDFGWMTTNAYVAWPFGILSTVLHIFMFLTDSRAPFRIYNASLVIWISGNFLWMTNELVDSSPSSDVHFGPRIPIGGIPEKDLERMVTAHTILFVLGAVVQIILYIAIYYRLVSMPQDDSAEDDEPRAALNRMIFSPWREFQRNMLDGGETRADRKDSHQQSDAHDVVIQFSLVGHSDPLSISLGQGDDGKRSLLTERDNMISVVCFENIYILFWLLKDIFWSGGTGDLTEFNHGLIIFYETMGIFFGALTLAVYVALAWLYRNHTERFLDCVTTMLWISANFVWMCGEFFVRYQSMTHDDDSQGHDNITRLIASVLFSCGIALQLYIVYAATCGRIRVLRRDGTKWQFATSAAIPTDDSMGAGTVDLHELECSHFSVTSPFASVAPPTDSVNEPPSAAAGAAATAYGKQQLPDTNHRAMGVEVLTLKTPIPFSQLMIAYSPQKTLLEGNSAYNGSLGTPSC